MAALGFYDPDSLHIRAYDALLAAGIPCLQGDTAFYRAHAAAAGGPVLELGCGTGRVALDLAARGVAVTAVDLSADLLAIAEDKARRLSDGATPPAFLRTDMRTLALGRRYPLIVSPFRTFHALLTPRDQAAFLQVARDHLTPGGVLILHLFDPPLDNLSSLRKPPEDIREVRDYWTGARILAELQGVEIEPYSQLIKNHWRYCRFDGTGAPETEQHLTLTVRWTYRQEMKHLLKLSGFSVVEEFGDFTGGAPAHGTEQVLVCKAL